MVLKVVLKRTYLWYEQFPAIKTLCNDEKYEGSCIRHKRKDTVGKLNLRRCVRIEPNNHAVYLDETISCQPTSRYSQSKERVEIAGSTRASRTKGRYRSCG